MSLSFFPRTLSKHSHQQLRGQFFLLLQGTKVSVLLGLIVSEGNLSYPTWMLGQGLVSSCHLQIGPGWEIKVPQPITESKTKQGQDRNLSSFCPPWTRVEKSEKHRENGGRKLEFQGPAPLLCWETGIASSHLGPAFSRPMNGRGRLAEGRNNWLQDATWDCHQSWAARQISVMPMETLLKALPNNTAVTLSEKGSEAMTRAKGEV